jgi:hypothetical protein
LLSCSPVLASSCLPLLTLLWLKPFA